MHSDYSLQTTLLERHLANAAAVVRRAEVRLALTSALVHVSNIVAICGVILAVEVAATRTAGTRLGPMASATGIVGLVGIGASVTSSLLRRRRPSLAEVAERLDLAAHDRNAIATALDLARNETTNALAERAIAHGVAAAERFASTPPFVTQAEFKLTRNAGVCAAGACAIALSLLTPSLDLRSVATSGHLGVPAIGSNSSLAADQHRMPTPPQSDRKAAEPPARLMVEQHASDSHSAKSADAQSGVAASANSISAGDSASTSGRPSDASSLVQQPVAGAEAAASGAASPIATEPENQTLLSASFGAASADAGLSQGVPSGSAGGDSVAIAKPAAGKSDLGGPTGKDGSAPAEPSGDGDGQPQGSGKANKKSEGGGQSEASGDGGGGSGRGGGQNPPKKSRGVAPLLLSVRQPDLLQGRPLPGPDERTNLQVPPRTDPQSLAAAADAASRIGLETAIDLYRVSAADRQAVADYFLAYHRVAETSAPPLK